LILHSLNTCLINEKNHSSEQGTRHWRSHGQDEIRRASVELNAEKNPFVSDRGAGDRQGSSASKLNSSPSGADQEERLHASKGDTGRKSEVYQGPGQTLIPRETGPSGSSGVLCDWVRNDGDSPACAGRQGEIPGEFKPDSTATEALFEEGSRRESPDIKKV